MTKQYYTTDEVAKGVEDLPPISKNTLRSLRADRKIKYTKVGITCVYKKKWIEDYLDGNTVEIAS